MTYMTRIDTVPIINVLGMHIHHMKTKDVHDTLVDFMHDGQPHSVYIVNAATANLAYEDHVYRDCLNRGNLVLNDGTGVRWAARWQGVRLEDNHVGTDLIPDLCEACRSWGMRVYLLGGRPGVAQRAAQSLATRFPGVNIVGHHHGYLTLAQAEGMCAEINAAGPHLLLVAMGNPLQELWIDRNLGRLTGGVAVGVGGLFDHLAGNLRRAPMWIRRAGCEWTQLLVQQPHKWRRYLIGNPLFLYRMIFGQPQEA